MVLILQRSVGFERNCTRDIHTAAPSVVPFTSVRSRAIPFRLVASIDDDVLVVYALQKFPNCKALRALMVPSIQNHVPPIHLPALTGWNALPMW